MINNIAVVKRHQNPFQFSDYLYPACLPKAETCLGFGTQVTVTGYGMFDRSYSHGFGGQVKIQSYDYGDFIRYTNQLKKATMSITKKSTCKWTSDNSHWYDYEYGLYNSLQFDSNNDGTDGHICAKGFIDAKSNNVANAGEVCGGDQGGPMTYFDNNGVATVVGVVSHGDCGDFGNVVNGQNRVHDFGDGCVWCHLMSVVC